MIEHDLVKIRNELIKQINFEGNLKVKDEVIEEACIRLNFISDFLSVNVSLEEITVFYSMDHDEFWKETYKDEQKWIKSAANFIRLLLMHSITGEYFYEASTMKLLYYKLWIENASNHRKLLKKVSTTMNLLSIFKRKVVISKVLQDKNY